jgi:catechol 2,3-dioxygenase-like lactoylglutathione lyase family enzyme
MIDHLDHLVLTTAHEAACIDFYTRVLGLALESFSAGSPPVARRAFKFGQQKINLHVQGSEFEPKAHLPLPGSLDLCFAAPRRLADSGRAGLSHRGHAAHSLGVCARPGPESD